MIIDISDPAEPFEIGYLLISGYSNSIVVIEDYVYIASSELGVHILDVSASTSPTKVASFWTIPDSVEVVDGYAYIGDSNKRLHVVDLINLLAPREVGYFDAIARMRGIDVNGEYVYVANGEGGLVILRFIQHRLHLPVVFHQYSEPAGAPIRQYEDWEIIG